MKKMTTRRTRTKSRVRAAVATCTSALQLSASRETSLLWSLRAEPGVPEAFALRSADRPRPDRDLPDEDQDAGDVSLGVDEEELESDDLDTDRVTSTEALAAFVNNGRGTEGYAALAALSGCAPTKPAKGASQA